VLKTKEDIYYRFKGCGNNYDGFPIRRVINGEKYEKIEKFEIRGCMFEHTTLRELFYTKKIQKILKEENILCCNKPVGWYCIFFKILQI
jgi:hypothetical protein